MNDEYFEKVVEPDWHDKAREIADGMVRQHKNNPNQTLMGSDVNYRAALGEIYQDEYIDWKIEFMYGQKWVAGGMSPDGKFNDDHMPDLVDEHGLIYDIKTLQGFPWMYEKDKYWCYVESGQLNKEHIDFARKNGELLDWEAENGTIKPVLSTRKKRSHFLVFHCYDQKNDKIYCLGVVSKTNFLLHMKPVKFNGQTEWKYGKVQFAIDFEHLRRFESIVRMSKDERLSLYNDCN